MENDLLSLVKSCKIFSSLDEKACKNLLPKFTQVFLKKGAILFRQGEPSDGLYVLIKGKLSGYLVLENNIEKPVRIIDAGDPVGELGTLANEPRSLTIKCLEDCILLKLSKEAFKQLCLDYPNIILETLPPLAKRTREMIQLLTPEKHQRHILLTPENEKLDLDFFMEILSKTISKNENILLLTDAIQKQHTEESLDQLIATADHTDKQIIFFPRSSSSPLYKKGIIKKSLHYLVAEGNTYPPSNKRLLEHFPPVTSNYTQIGLILVYKKEKMHPMHTDRWLKAFPFAVHHHVRCYEHLDVDRLLRFLIGKPISLVLGGGGGKGWVHMGAIKALIDSAIPIDIIGGTSVGALAAGCYAVHEYQFGKALSVFRELMYAARSTASWKNLTWPAISLFNCKEYTTLQKSLFEHVRIENLWLPYFCVTSNLANNNETVHRSGLLWERIRASVAIPGLIPPMVLGGECHVDGGLLNNLPTDIMRSIVGDKGIVIAIDISYDELDYTKYEFPPGLTFKEALLSKWKIAFRHFRFPSFLDSFFRALLIGSSTKTKINSGLADIIINPNLGNFRTLSRDNSQDDILFGVGYQNMLTQIKEKNLKEKVLFNKS